jgi:hypothetical protein
MTSTHTTKEKYGRRIAFWSRSSRNVKNVIKNACCALYSISDRGRHRRPRLWQRMLQFLIMFYVKVL